MGKVDRVSNISNRVEPFTAPFWALGFVLANT